MKKTTQRFTLLLIAVLLMLSLSIPVGAASDEGDDGYEFGELGEKKAQPLVTPGQYEITVSVPGAVETEEYSEIIVMVDASSSQGANLSKLKAMLVELAEEVLHNDGSVRLTLMGYGMGPARVGSFYNADTLAAYLENVTQADLRQGVSATNCEAALEFVREYIEQSDKLHKTFVIFTSDGNTNMDETTFKLSEWTDHPEWYAKNVTAADIVGVAAGCQADMLVTDGTVLAPTAALYPDECVALALAQNTYGLDSDEYKAAVDMLYNAITTTQDSGVEYVNAVWADVFANSNMTYGEAYSTSKLEKAFLDYFDGAFTNSFLYTIHRMVNEGVYPDYYNLSTWGARAAAAADKLSANDKVLELYMMDFANKTKTWMNPASTTTYHCTSDKITYNTASSFTAAVDKISTLGDEMFVTVYRDTTIIDPMSKWVTLDPSSIRIYEDDLLIYQYGQGWLYDDRQPAENPITLTVNEDGRYQITWRIKDGNLLYTDRYFLKYTVDVNQNAEGFEHDKMYPANDTTTVEYLDASGTKHSVGIAVPNVKEASPAQDFAPGDKGFKIYKGSSIDGSPISDIHFDVYHVVPGEGEALTANPPYEEYSKYMTGANFVGTIVTDGSGYGSMNLTELGYDDGFYLIVEQASSKVKVPLSPFYVSIPMRDPETGEPMEILVMYPKNEPIIPDNPMQPDIPVDPETPDTGRITILKHSNVNQSIVLEGAQFQIYRLAASDETPTVTVEYGGVNVGLIPVMINGEPAIITTGADGIGTSQELEFGMYFLIETKAPDGYYIKEEPVAVFVSATSHEVSNAVMISNSTGVQLPETGGPGTFVFTFLGTALCAVAVVMFIVKKRRNEM